MIKKQNEEFYTNKHSKFLLQYHLVIVTKYRRKVIINDLRDSLIEYTKHFFKDRNLNIIELNTDKDHIHILFESHPNLNLSTFINSYKSSSSRKMRNRFNDMLSKYYWKPYFCSRSYFICTVSERSEQYVKQYIQNQGIQ